MRASRAERASAARCSQARAPDQLRSSLQTPAHPLIRPCTAREVGIHAIYSGHDHNSEWAGSMQGVRCAAPQSRRCCRCTCCCHRHCRATAAVPENRLPGPAAATMRRAAPCRAALDARAHPPWSVLPESMCARLAYGRKSGYGGYGPPEGWLRGARVVELRLGEDAAVRWGWGLDAPRRHATQRLRAAGWGQASGVSACPAALGAVSRPSACACTHHPAAARPGYGRRMGRWWCRRPGAPAAALNPARLCCVCLDPALQPGVPSIARLTAAWCAPSTRSEEPKDMRQLICHCDEFERRPGLQQQLLAAAGGSGTAAAAAAVSCSAMPAEPAALP